MRQDHEFGGLVRRDRPDAERNGLLVRAVGFEVDTEGSGSNRHQVHRPHRLRATADQGLADRARARKGKRGAIIHKTIRLDFGRINRGVAEQFRFEILSPRCLLGIGGLTLRAGFQGQTDGKQHDQQDDDNYEKAGSAHDRTLLDLEGLVKAQLSGRMVSFLFNYLFRRTALMSDLAAGVKLFVTT